MSRIKYIVLFGLLISALQIVGQVVTPPVVPGELAYLPKSYPNEGAKTLNELSFKSSSSEANEDRPLVSEECLGATAVYRIEGEVGSTYEWVLTDQTGATVTWTTLTGETFTMTTTTITTGGTATTVTIFGSQTAITWQETGTFNLDVIQTSVHTCKTIKLGEIQVYPQPTIWVIPTATVCPNGTFTPQIPDQIFAENSVKFLWTSPGDGIFNDKSRLDASYKPGIIDINAGSVQLTVVAYGLGDIPGCQTATATITLLIQDLEADVRTSTISCNGLTDGIITLENSRNGTPAYKLYLGGNGIDEWFNNDTYSGLSAGTYRVKVGDANNCERDLGSHTILEPPKLTANVGTFTPTCRGNDGQIIITNPRNAASELVGVPGIYKYIIEKENSSFFKESEMVRTSTYTEIFGGLATGTYTVSMFDAAPGINCIREIAKVTLTEPEPLIVAATATDVTCFGSDDGTVSITIHTGGSGNYEYMLIGTLQRTGAPWNSGWKKDTELIGTMPPGEFTLTMRDANNQLCESSPVGPFSIGEPQILAGAATPTDEKCWNAKDGTVLIETYSGGHGTYEFKLAGNLLDGTQTSTVWGSKTLFANLAPGTYTLQMRDVQFVNCTQPFPKNYIILPAEKLLATVTPVPVKCYGDINGEILITDAKNGKEPYEFSINNGATWSTSTTITGLIAGTYTVTMLDANTCSNTLDPAVEVKQPEKLIANESHNIETIAGIDVGTVTVTAQGGTPTYLYSINGSVPGTNAAFTNLAMGTYTITITDSNDCSTDLSFKLDATIKATPLSYPVTCFGGIDGSIVFTNYSGGSGVHEFSIKGGIDGSWQDSFSFTGYKADDYKPVIRDKNDHSLQSSFGTLTITQLPQITFKVRVVQPEQFPGAINGIIEVYDISGGSNSYNFRINGGTWTTTTQFSGLTQGSYTIDVGDPNSNLSYCFESKSIDLGVKGILTLNAAPQVESVRCYGGTGTITITASGVDNIEYSVDGGSNWQLNNGVFIRVAGKYNLVIRDADQIGNKLPIPGSGPLGTWEIKNPPRLNLHFIYDDPTCLNAYATISIWGDGGTGQITGDVGVNKLPVGDSKTYYIYDQNGCEASQYFEAKAVISITSTPTVTSTCFGVPGSVSFSAPSGGKGPYTYTLRGSSLTRSNLNGIFNNLPSGQTYTLTITDSKGCNSNEIPVQVGPMVPLKVTATPLSSLCSGGVVDVFLSVSGGTSPYKLLDGTLITGSTITQTVNLSAGTQTFTVNDLNNCTATITISPVSPPAPPNVEAIPLLCYENTGTIRVTSPLNLTSVIRYEYSIDGGSSWTSSTTFTGLIPESTQNIQVKDLTTNCISGPTTIKVGGLAVPPPAPSLTVSIKPNCRPNEKGTIVVNNPSSGYQYSIDGGTYTTATSFGNLTVGTHTVTVLDGTTSCTNTASISMVKETDPPTPVLAVTPPNCIPFVGAITVISPVLSGTYQFSINGGANYTSSTSFAGLIPGNTYTITVKNMLTECISEAGATVSTTVPVTPAPIIALTATPTCDNVDGTVAVTSPTGSDFRYSIDGGAYQASPIFAVKGGTHTITVKNLSTGCISIAGIKFVPAVPPTPVLTATAVDPLCYGDPYFIKLTTSADPGIYPISYDGGQFNNVTFVGGTATITGIITNDKDFKNLKIVANGCTSTGTLNDVRIKIPAQIDLRIVKVTEQALKGTQKGAIDIAASGGTGTLAYLWSNSATTQDLNNISFGNYSVTVTDTNSCTRTLSVKVPLNIPPVARPDSSLYTCYPVTGNLLANDYDPDPPEQNDFITINTNAVVKPKNSKTFVINKDGTFVYEVLPGFSGVDFFVYEIFDKLGQTATATVTITVVSDFDGDGIADEDDPDADGDGILNVLEVLNGQDWKTADSDGDGHFNWLDIDSDNDGIVDNIEAQVYPRGYILPSGKDINNNGIDDVYDPLVGGTQLIPVDTDLTLYQPDGIPDFLDVDSDNDMVPDYIEGHDSNADGKPDRKLTGKDSDADGLDDGYETIVNGCNNGNAIGAMASLQDFDGDGLADWRDENDDDDEYLTRYEDLNLDGDYSNDVLGHVGHPEYLWYGRDCELMIPNAFSPNDDNIHDFFQIYCIEQYPNAKMYIFDQLGNKVYEKVKYGNVDFWGSNDEAWWDGRTKNRIVAANGGKVPAGTYYYVLQLGNGEVKKSFVFVSY